MAALQRKRDKKTVGQGIRLKGQTKTIIANVYDYFNDLHRKGQSQGPVKRTADATSEPLRVCTCVI